MKNPDTPRKAIPLHDYDLALEKAVSWLGDRYLLAEPAPRRREEPRQYFSEPQRWNRALRGRGLTRH
jgi:hypothetical protein